MAFFTMDITSQNTIVASPAKRNHALRMAFKWIGDYWHKHYKMEKFKTSAYRKYGLTPRSGETGSRRPFKGSYTYRKIHKAANGQGVHSIGENKPFVWSGKSRSDAQASTKVVATAARGYGKADCIINAPTLNLKPKGGTINLREEFERVTEEERRFVEREAIIIYELFLTQGKGEQIRISA